MFNKRNPPKAFKNVDVKGLVHPTFSYLPLVSPSIVDSFGFMCQDFKISMLNVMLKQSQDYI